MPKPRFTRKILLPIITVIVMMLAIVACFGVFFLHKYTQAHIKASLTQTSTIIRYELEQHSKPLKQITLDSLMTKYAQLLTNVEVTVVDTEGRVLADSLYTPDIIGNIANKPEIKSAFNGQNGSDRRYSFLFDNKVTYVSIPFTINGKLRAAIRLGSPQSFISPQYNKTLTRFLAVLVVAGCLAIVTVIFITKQITKPLKTMQSGTQSFANSDLKARMPTFNSRELDTTAYNINQMAAHLDNRIQKESQQRNEVESVFSSMSEGVIAIDTDERIFRINRAASNIMGVPLENIRGQTIQSRIRNAELQEIIRRVLSENNEVEGNIVLYEGQEKYVQVRSAAIKNAAGTQIGAVAVLNDISQMRKLENIRRDFVANVSHEIRTPVTSIQGFVETLLDGALENKDNTRHFLHIIQKHTTRLNAILEDLLSLSRLENSNQENALPFEVRALTDLLRSAVQMVQQKADDKEIHIAINVSEKIRLKVNPTLFEQAVVNLLDNAVNYSDCGSTVEVIAEVNKKELVIAVTDHGCGIPQEHLPRIFERFYRVDKGRSREPGGTGLGLAILKHIAQIHQGRVSVDSTLNTGSTFRFHIPRSRIIDL